MLDQVVHEENLRSIAVGKNTLNVRREDPYGFWTIHFERGTIPAELEGTFTSFDEAWKKISIYLGKRPQETDEVEKKTYNGSA